MSSNTNLSAFRQGADRHVQAYGDAVNITVPDQLPRGMGILIIVAARAIEKYCGTPKAVLILLQAASAMMAKPAKREHDNGY